ncbi:hypothetical protein SK803_32690 [Lentzea sp. BCCO 10_0856]|uniref:Uncharacterized protein n=1 Tax=Lentzea miocenica TaxID=3095431 RepID=A0ABU4TA02_9PSEU|nr:hypothetical protein [Lentzea sp. BCCO 10_0856]
MDLVVFRRVSTAVMVVLMAAFLVSAVAGAVRGGHPTSVTLSLPAAGGSGWSTRFWRSSPRSR